ncbi:MAG: DUF5320 domain-containing protein [Candidatus Hadarchaeota archaeon]
MPRGDGTGQLGMGPMTGRGAGYCAGYNTPGFANSVPRAGLGLRRGRGRFGGQGRRRNMFYLTGQPGWMRFGFSPGWSGTPPGLQYTNQGTQQGGQAPQGSANPISGPQAPGTQDTSRQEVKVLENQMEALKAQMDQIRERIDQLKR